MQKCSSKLIISGEIIFLESPGQKTRQFIKNIQSKFREIELFDFMRFFFCLPCYEVISCLIIFPLFYMHFGNFFQLFNEPGSVIYKDARVISKAVKSKKMDLEAAKVSRDNRGTRGTRRITPKTKRYAAEVID